MLGLTKWPVHVCAHCRCECNYVFVNGKVFYDASCRCLSDKMERTSWEEVAEHYNTQRCSQVIAEMDAFWGFEAPVVQH